MESQKRLEKLLRRGRLHFVLVRGMLFFGVGAAVLASAWDSWQYQLPFVETLLGRLPIFLLSGVFFGLFLWFHLNRQYRRYFNH